MDLLTMSPKEVNRLEVMQRLDKRGMKQRVAAELLEAQSKSRFWGDKIK
jgi:hypothetical protein